MDNSANKSLSFDFDPKDYHARSDVLLSLWIDNILTDGEYNRIMDGLNAKAKQN